MCGVLENSNSIRSGSWRVTTARNPFSGAADSRSTRPSVKRNVAVPPVAVTVRVSPALPDVGAVAVASGEDVAVVVGPDDRELDGAPAAGAVPVGDAGGRTGTVADAPPVVDAVAPGAGGGADADVEPEGRGVSVTPGVVSPAGGGAGSRASTGTGAAAVGETLSPTIPTAARVTVVATAVTTTHATTIASRRRTATVCPYRCGMASVFLIEDDRRIRETLVVALAERGHDVEASAAAFPALQRIVGAAPDVVVLDLGLPDLDGVDALRMLRGVTSVPVVVATARDDEDEIVRTLDLGADDYIVKPFSAAQLDARIRAVLRRVGEPPTAPIAVGGLRIDVAGRVVTMDGTPVELSRKEFELLAYLAARPGVVVTKRELLAEIWRLPYGGADKTVDVHLSWLRRKLGETAAAPRYLHTLRGVGVKLVAPAT